MQLLIKFTRDIFSSSFPQAEENLSASKVKTKSDNFFKIIKVKSHFLFFYELRGIMFLFSTFLLVSANVFAQNGEIEKLLKLDIEELTDLKVVSATKMLDRISQVPATVEVITSEMIKQNGYLTLEDALANLPGFQFRNIIGFNSYVFQRGIPNQNNLALLLVDGIPINEQNSGGFYAGGQFNLDDVEQIEAVYGPASALYGTNAISGIINVITKEPQDDQNLHVSGLIGSFKTYSGNISYGYYNEQEQTGFRISGMYKSSEKADLSEAQGDFNWTSGMENFEDDYSLNIKTVYRDFKLGMIYQNKRSSRTTNYKSIGTDYLDKNTLWNIGFLNTYLKHHYSFAENLDIQTTFTYRNSIVYDNTIAYITDSSQAGYYRPNYSFSGETMVLYSPFASLKIIGGALFEREFLADDFSITFSEAAYIKPAVPAKPKIDNNNLLSLYLQTQLSIINSISLFTGVRYDNSTVYDSKVTPRLGLVFNKDKLTLKVLYSEAFRAPKPWDYSNGLGNPDLQSEEMKSFEVAGSYYGFKNFQLALSFYKNKLNELITQENIGSSFKWINQGDVKTEGLEISVKHHCSIVNSYANYTYNFSEDSSGTMMPEIAKHTANAGVVFEPVRNIRFSIRCNYLGKRMNTKVISTTGNNIIDDAFIFFASALYSGFDDFIFSLTVNNIFDKTYYHTSNRPPDRYRQPQRTILFKIDYTF